MSRRRRRHRYAMPTDVHSTEEADRLVLLAVLLMLVLSALALARVIAFGSSDCFSATVASLP